MVETQTPQPVVSDDAETPASQPTSIPTGLRELDAPEQDMQLTDEGPVIVWTASEYIAHDKSVSWFASLIAVAVVVAALLYLITRDLFIVFVSLFGALMVAVYGSRKPRQLQYQLDHGGITAGKRFYGYEEFRNFSVVQEDAFASIVFTPLKRFAIPLTIYYPPEYEDAIAELLVDRVPFERQTLDPVERLMRKIRF